MPWRPNILGFEFASYIPSHPPIFKLSPTCAFQLSRNTADILSQHFLYNGHTEMYDKQSL